MRAVELSFEANMGIMWIKKIKEEKNVKEYIADLRFTKSKGIWFTLSMRQNHFSITRLCRNPKKI